MQKVTCPLCGKMDIEICFQGPDRIHESRKFFTLLSCKSCGLFFLSPENEVEHFEDLYPEDYFPYAKKIKREDDRWGWINQRAAIRKKFTSINNLFLHPGRVLEIGCATGLLLKEFKDNGWKVEGVEPSKSAVQYAKSELHLDLHENEFSQGQFSTNSFDVVMLWDVFEHLPDPFTFLADAVNVLKPGGWLVLNIPNPDSVEAKLFGRYWAGWDIPRHQYIFSRSTLEKTFQSLPLSIKMVKSITGAFGGLTISMDFWFKEHLNHSFLYKIFKNPVSSIILRIISYPILFLENVFNKSSYMTIFIKKNGNH